MGNIGDKIRIVANTLKEFGYNAFRFNTDDPTKTRTAIGGALLGALSGGLNPMFDDPEDSKRERRQRRIRHALIGAGVGGVGATMSLQAVRNLIGNRIRPFSYDPKSHGGELLGYSDERDESGNLKLLPWYKMPIELAADMIRTPAIASKYNTTRKDYLMSAGPRDELLMRYLGYNMDKPHVNLGIGPMFERMPNGTIKPIPGHESFIDDDLYLRRGGYTTTTGGSDAARVIGETIAGIKPGDKPSAIPVNHMTYGNAHAILDPATQTVTLKDKWDVALKSNEPGTNYGSWVVGDSGRPDRVKKLVTDALRGLFHSGIAARAPSVEVTQPFSDFTD